MASDRRMEEGNMESPTQRPGRGAYLATMISLASAAFGVVAALAWNEAITALVSRILGRDDSVVGLFIYAVVITVVAVLVMVGLARAAERTSGESVI